MPANGSRRLILGLALAVAAGLPVSGQEIWLSPRGGPQGANNISLLFKDDAAWANVRKYVGSFEFNANLKEFGDDELKHIFGYLGRRRIGLAYGLLAVSGDGTCGFGVEGYSSKGDPLRIAKQIKSLGAEVRYYVMDEPLWFGHNFAGRKACHAPIDDIAADVATKVSDVRSVFPAAQVGDIEPVGVPNEHWLADLEYWLTAFREHSGQNLAFVRADIQWTKSWRPQMRELEHLLRRNGIPLQVIYNGDGDTDAEWADLAARHFEEYETVAAPPPDVPVFQNWTPQPSRVLPETDGETLTGIAWQYIKWRESRR